MYLGTTIRSSVEIKIGGDVYNLNGGANPKFPRAAGVGIFARPMPVLALSFDARWKLVDGDHSSRYGGGAELFLHTSNGQIGYPIRVGALHDSGLGTTYISGGLGLAGMKLGIDLAPRPPVSAAHH